MRALQRLVVPTWTGFVLIITGFLCYVSSFLLLPLYVTTFNCLDSCEPPKYATACEFSLNLFSLIPEFSLSHPTVTPITDSILLVLLYLPLLTPALMVGCDIAFLAHSRRMLATWSRRIWLIGGIALVAILPFLLIFVLPQIGYVGMLFGYGLLWVGNRIILTARPRGASLA